MTTRTWSLRTRFGVRSSYFSSLGSVQSWFLQLNLTLIFLEPSTVSSLSFFSIWLNPCSHPISWLSFQIHYTLGRPRAELWTHYEVHKPHLVIIDLDNLQTTIHNHMHLHGNGLIHSSHPYMMIPNIGTCSDKIDLYARNCSVSLIYDPLFEPQEPIARLTLKTVPSTLAHVSRQWTGLV